MDASCPPKENGRLRKCIASAGCYARTRKLYWNGVISLAFDRDWHLSNNGITADSNNNDNTVNQDVTIPKMSRQDENTFETLLLQYLAESPRLKGKLDISNVRASYSEYDRPCVQVAVDWDNDMSKRTSLDVEIQVVGEYIPIDSLSFTDQFMGNEIIDSINVEQGIQSFINSMKQSSTFFMALREIYAIDEESVVEVPSASPSLAPTRSFDQSLEVRIDPGPTGSYGLIFTVRTPKGGNTILLKGMQFVTLHEGILEYEVYSKLGPYQKFVGYTTAFDFIASGQVTGKGAKEYVRVLADDSIVENENTTEVLEYKGFTPVHVPGDGGQRTIFITITNRFKNEEGEAIPILFSYPLEGDNDGKKIYGKTTSNKALEIYEGDGVLSYPWVKNLEGPYYRRPRGFIGTFDYDRNPCAPVENFTSWPCPYVAPPKVTRRPTPSPTSRPTYPPITMTPIASASPTSRPTTTAPTTEKPVEIMLLNNTALDGDSEMPSNDTLDTDSIEVGIETNNLTPRKEISYILYGLAATLCCCITFMF